MARDEIKHLAIMSAADRYLFGPRHWRRFLALVKKGLGNFTGQRRSRSGGEVLGSNTVTALEGVAALLHTGANTVSISGRADWRLPSAKATRAAIS